MLKFTDPEEINGVTVLHAQGRITLGEGSTLLRDTVKGLLKVGKKKILLDMADVGYIDNSGIGELVSAAMTVRREGRHEGGELKLVNLTKRTHDLLQITKLYTVFEVFGHHQDHDMDRARARAIASFGPVLPAPRTASSQQDATNG